MRIARSAHLKGTPFYVLSPWGVGVLVSHRAGRQPEPALDRHLEMARRSSLLACKPVPLAGCTPSTTNVLALVPTQREAAWVSNSCFARLHRILCCCITLVTCHALFVCVITLEQAHFQGQPGHQSKSLPPSRQGNDKDCQLCIICLDRQSGLKTQPPDTLGTSADKHCQVLYQSCGKADDVQGQ
jgi:hypothetical protein